MKLSNKRGSESWDPHYPIRQRRERQEATTAHVHLLQRKHIVNEWKQHQWNHEGRYHISTNQWIFPRIFRCSLMNFCMKGQGNDLHLQWKEESCSDFFNGHVSCNFSVTDLLLRLQKRNAGKNDFSVDENRKIDFISCVPLRCLLLALMRRQARNLLVTRRNLWE